MLFHVCEILHLFIKKPQHSQSNPTFPQCPTVELSHPQRPALSQSHFKVRPKEASDLNPAAALIPWSESSSPEVTGWHHHLMVCKTPTYLCENKPFITHICRLNMKKWPRNLGVWVLLSSCHRKFVTYFVWEEGLGMGTNNRNSILS